MTTSRPAKPAKTLPVEAPKPFDGCLDYLDAWFVLLGPAREDVETPATQGRIPSFDERRGYLAFLLARTDLSIKAGVPLPFEDYVRLHELDLLDRVILLALLRAAHDPVGEGGLPLVRLLWALGANTLGRQEEVLSRVETSGRLRDLGAVHCYPYPDRVRRAFRLAPWLVGPLTTGEGDPDGLPVLPADPLESIDLIAGGAGRLIEAVNADTTLPFMVWQAPAEGGPGWDTAALRRRRLAARLEVCVRSQGCPVGLELRRLGLVGDERIGWAVLFWDNLKDPISVPVSRLVMYCGRNPDPAVAAERLFGPDSKLGRADVLRFNRADVPLLRRLVWMAQEAHSRVVPWRRGDHTVKPGPTGEPTSRPRSLGFDANGASAEGRSTDEVRALQFREDEG